ncbi:MAG TPA: hypothetical protein VG346_13995 [Acidimicrobiales bacterium]|nr:hypothetical protein [Acidimicrobiales bacterium]
MTAALPVLAVVASAVLPSAVPPAGASNTVPAYWLVASDGGIFAFGGAPFYGSTGAMALTRPVVGIASTPGGGGYWEVASDGGIFAYGNAPFEGSTGNIALNRPVVGMASTRDGGGYWLVASDGGIFSFGDAQFYGSTGNMHLNQPVVAMAATPDGGGYWLVAADGGIFAFGDAQFYGSTGSMVLNKPIVGMIADTHGAGYFLVASDGGIFSFGTAPFFGSLGGVPLRHPIVGAAVTPGDDGYWFTDSTGLVSNFGSANYYGSAPSPLSRPVVGMAEAPGNGDFVGGTYPPGAYGYDISKYQCSNFPTGDHAIGIVQVDGSSLGNTNPCLAQEAAWAGGGLNLYTYLTYFTSGTNEPGCNGDPSCNAGYQAGIGAFTDAQNAGAGSTSIPWWLDVETADANWSGNLAENAQFVAGALIALHESEGIPEVGIYASPGLWNGIVGNYQPDVPYWMADYLSSPSGPGSCADYPNWAAKERLPTGPLQIVQYNSAQFDEDYAC